MAGQRSIKLWVVNIISFIIFCLLAVTGLINWLVLPRGGGRGSGLMETRHLLMDVHAWLAVLFLVVIIVHMLLHSSYIKANLAKSGWLQR